MNFPSYALEDFVYELPEVQFDCGQALRFIMKNFIRGDSPLTGYLELEDSHQDKLLVGHLPDWFCKPLNDQANFDETKWNYGNPLFNQPVAIISKTDDDHLLHTDRSRPGSLNFLIHGDPLGTKTFFEVRGERVYYQYKPNVATVFNTQIGHGVVYPTADLRILLSFRMSIGLQHFLSLYQLGLIFGDDNANLEE